MPGRGIVHAEYNGETERDADLPDLAGAEPQGVAPGWGTRAFRRRARACRCWPRATGTTARLPLHADGAVLAGKLAAGQVVHRTLRPGQRAYLVASSGSITVNGHKAGTRDGVAVQDEAALEIAAVSDAEVVLVETW